MTKGWFCPNFKGTRREKSHKWMDRWIGGRTNETSNGLLLI